MKCFFILALCFLAIVGCNRSGTAPQFSQTAGCALSYSWPASNHNWVTLGSANFSAGTATATSIAVAPNGTPYVAYVDGANGSGVTVMKFSGSTWSVVGTTAFSPGAATLTNIAIAPNGTPYVAFEDSVGSGPLVMAYTNGSWGIVGSGNLGSTASAIGFAISPSGIPYVAASIAGTTTVLYYSAGNWNQLGAPVGTGASYLTLNFDPLGTLYVGLNVGGSVTIDKYCGGGWQTIGTGQSLSIGALGCTWSSNAFTPDSFGNVFVAGQCGAPGPTSAYQYTSQGCCGSWSSGIQISTSNTTTISMKTDYLNTPYVLFANSFNGNKATVMKYSGGAWSTVGTSGFSANSAATVSLAIDSCGVPYAAYQDNAAGITVMGY